MNRKIEPITPSEKMAEAIESVKKMPLPDFPLELLKMVQIWDEFATEIKEVYEKIKRLEAHDERD